MQALEIATVNDLVRILDEHPQWLEALRERLLTREVLDLPQQLAEFAANTDRRFEVVERQLEAQGRELEAQGLRLGRVEDQLEAQGRELEEQGRQLKQLRDDIGPIKAAHVRNAARNAADMMAEAQGLEFVDILDRKELGAMVRSADTRGISKGDLDSFRFADMVLRATDADGADCYVAVEVSYTANGRDTDRAMRNAEYLTRFTGNRALAVVAGRRFDDRISKAVKSGAVAWYELSAQALEVD